MCVMRVLLECECVVCVCVCVCEWVLCGAVGACARARVRACVGARARVGGSVRGRARLWPVEGAGVGGWGGEGVSVGACVGGGCVRACVRVELVCVGVGVGASRVFVGLGARVLVRAGVWVGGACGSGCV